MTTAWPSTAQPDAGADPGIVTGWIAEVTAERTRHQIALDRANGQTRLTRDQIAGVVSQLTSLTQLLSDADPQDRAEVYTQLRLALTYDHEKRLVTAEARPDQACTKSSVRGGT